jgi:glyoxylase-like metal-dependent hydrolase (beta-lactamase superfamily II)
MYIEEEKSVPAGFMAFRLGELELRVVTDGAVPYDSNCFAPGISRSQVNALWHDHYMDTKTIALAHNILVIKSHNRIVLIDAGNGDKAGKDAGRLPENLLQAGIPVNAVTDIVLTHAHPDHINGLTDALNRPVFPHAQVHVSKTEFDFWMSVAPDFSNSKNSKMTLSAMQRQAMDFFTVCHDRLHFFSGEDKLFGFLQPLHAPGHTPGHYMFAITSGNETFIHSADIFHEEVILFAQPDWGTIFDTDFALAAATRKKVLEQFAHTRQRVFAYHLPWPGLGHVRKINDTYSWIPERYMTPPGY